MILWIIVLLQFCTSYWMVLVRDVGDESSAVSTMMLPGSAVAKGSIEILPNNNHQRTTASRRNVPRTTATICKTSHTTKKLNQTWFKSQAGEDKELLKWFINLCGGTYIEMGALDGIAFSNSYVFHKALEWKGVLVEASPRNYDLLVQNRPDELAVTHAGVCDVARDLHWVEGVQPTVGGFLEFAAPAFIKLWWTQEAIANATVIACQPLTTLLEETVVGKSYFFDFFSLDIEGGEYTALKSLDFERYQFGILVVEADEHNELKNMAIRTLLEANGYTFLYERAVRGIISMMDNRSYWFVHKDFDEIYSNVIHGS